MKKTPSIIILIAFLANIFGPVPMARADDFRLPAPGVMVRLSPPLDPPILKGIKVHPDNPFQFDFILDQGTNAVVGSNEASKLVKYFLASLTIPEKDLWVNLSPYEKDRIVPASFGLTEMGRDLLAEDYMLKQITASLIYPEDRTGKEFWKRIYQEAYKKFGTTNIPVNTFNKVWIVPQKAVVYENAQAGTAYVVESKLRVMLEQDYLSMTKHMGASQGADVNKLGSDIVREVVIPELTKEVNEGRNFAQLRQVYNSLILAAWYKKKIKDSILAQVYEDKKKVAGVGYKNTINVESIYLRYLQAFKKGVFNYIKEEPDPMTQENIPRKYFSGGVDFAMGAYAEKGMKGIGGVMEVTDKTSLLRAIFNTLISGALEEIKVDLKPSEVSAPDISISVPGGYSIIGGKNNPRLAQRLQGTIGLPGALLGPGVYSPLQDNGLSLEFMDIISSYIQKLDRGTLKNNEIRVLEIGSGSGLGSLTAFHQAKHLGYQVKIDAVDITDEAVENTKKNFELLKDEITARDSVRIFKVPGDGQLNDLSDQYDLILFYAPDAVPKKDLNGASVAIRMDQEIFKRILQNISDRLLAKRGVAIIGSQKNIRNTMIPSGLGWNIIAGTNEGSIDLTRAGVYLGGQKRDRVFFEMTPKDQAMVQSDVSQDLLGKTENLLEINRQDWKKILEYGLTLKKINPPETGNFELEDLIQTTESRRSSINLYRGRIYNIENMPSYVVFEFTKPFPVLSDLRHPKPGERYSDIRGPVVVVWRYIDLRANRPSRILVKGTDADVKDVENKLSESGLSGVPVRPLKGYAIDPQAFYHSRPLGLLEDATGTMAVNSDNERFINLEIRKALPSSVTKDSLIQVLYSLKDRAQMATADEKAQINARAKDSISDFLTKSLRNYHDINVEAQFYDSINGGPLKKDDYQFVVSFKDDHSAQFHAQVLLSGHAITALALIFPRNTTKFFDGNNMMKNLLLAVDQFIFNETGSNIGTFETPITYDGAPAFFTKFFKNYGADANFVSIKGTEAVRVPLNADFWENLSKENAQDRAMLNRAIDTRLKGALAHHQIAVLDYGLDRDLIIGYLISKGEAFYEIKAGQVSLPEISEQIKEGKRIILAPADLRLGEDQMVEFLNIIGFPSGFLFSTIQEVSQNQEEYFAQPGKDDLTGLYNRGGFKDMFRQFLGRAARLNNGRVHMIMAMVDIDHFKAYNDLFSHQLGDEVLKSIAGNLLASTRAETDLIGRWGGEEFTLLLPVTEQDHADPYNGVRRVHANIGKYAGSILNDKGKVLEALKLKMSTNSNAIYDALIFQLSLQNSMSRTTLVSALPNLETAVQAADGRLTKPDGTPYKFEKWVITSSIGAVEYDHEITSPSKDKKGYELWIDRILEETIQEADQRLYQVKQNGRNSIDAGNFTEKMAEAGLDQAMTTAQKNGRRKAILEQERSRINLIFLHRGKENVDIKTVIIHDTVTGFSNYLNGTVAKRTFSQADPGRFVAQQSFSGVALNAGMILNELLRNGLINANGEINEEAFNKLKKTRPSYKALPGIFNDGQKKQIYGILRNAPKNGDVILRGLINEGVLQEVLSPRGDLTLVRLKNREQGDVLRPKEIKNTYAFDKIWNTLQPTQTSLLQVLGAIASTHYDSNIRPVREQKAQDRKKKNIEDIIKYIDNLFKRSGEQYSLYFIEPKPAVTAVTETIANEPTLTQEIRTAHRPPQQLSLFPKGDKAMTGIKPYEALRDFLAGHNVEKGWCVEFDLDKTRYIESSLKDAAIRFLDEDILRNLKLPGVAVFATRNTSHLPQQEEGFIYIPNEITQEELSGMLKKIRDEFSRETKSTILSEETVTFAVVRGSDLAAYVADHFQGDKTPEKVIAAMELILKQLLTRGKGEKSELRIRDANYGNKSVFFDPNGGIDFTAERTPLEVRHGGGEIKFHIDPAMLAELRNAPGFVPVIINIQPMNDLRSFLGIVNQT